MSNGQFLFDEDFELEDDSSDEEIDWENVDEWDEEAWEEVTDDPEDSDGVVTEDPDVGDDAFSYEDICDLYDNWDEMSGEEKMSAIQEIVDLMMEEHGLDSVPVQEDPDMTEYDGFFHEEEREISIRSGALDQTPGENINTAIHESAHAVDNDTGRFDNKYNLRFLDERDENGEWQTVVDAPRSFDEQKALQDTRHEEIKDYANFVESAISDYCQEKDSVESGSDQDIQDSDWAIA